METVLGKFSHSHGPSVCCRVWKASSSFTVQHTWGMWNKVIRFIQLCLAGIPLFVFSARFHQCNWSSWRNRFWCLRRLLKTPRSALNAAMMELLPSMAVPKVTATEVKPFKPHFDHNPPFAYLFSYHSSNLSFLCGPCLPHMLTPYSSWSSIGVFGMCSYTMSLLPLPSPGRLKPWSKPWSNPSEFRWKIPMPPVTASWLT